MTWTLIAQIAVLLIVLLVFAVAITLLVAFARTMPKRGPDEKAVQEHSATEHLASLSLPTCEEISQEAQKRHGLGPEYQHFSAGASWAVRFVRDQAGGLR